MSACPGRSIKLAPLPDRGLHPKAAIGLKRRYSGTPTDVLRYHNDNYPTGWNQSETDLTPATVGSASFGQLTTLNVDGNVMAQPLMVSNFTMPDNSVHNVLIVATGNDTVYAYDAQTYAILWQRSLGTQQSTGDVGCGDIQGGYGISSTPVIVRSGNMPRRSMSLPRPNRRTSPSTPSFMRSTSAPARTSMSPREIAPKAKLATGGKIHFDPQNQWSRSSLAYNNGSIYMGIGSHCDNNAGAISGWVLRYDAATLKLTGKFNTIEAAAGYELSSIWMSGYSVAIDPTGNVYAITGNGNYNLGKGMKGYGESVIALSPDLAKKPVGTFTPSNGSRSTTATPISAPAAQCSFPSSSGQTAPPMIIGPGKAGTAYLLDCTHLKGLEGHNGYQALQKIIDGGCWCGPGYYGGGTRRRVLSRQRRCAARLQRRDTGTPKLTQIATSSDTAADSAALSRSSRRTGPRRARRWYGRSSAAIRPSRSRPIMRQASARPCSRPMPATGRTAAVPI